MTPREERDRWIEAGLEPEFMVWGPDQNDEGRDWDVVDAECTVIATCKSELHAKLLAAALDDYNHKMWFEIEP